VADLTLEIVEGPGAGRRVPLTGALEVGRDAQAGFRVEDEHVDALHVRVTPDGDGPSSRTWESAAEPSSTAPRFTCRRGSAPATRSSSA
jgi:hypothetical protein